MSKRRKRFCGPTQGHVTAWTAGLSVLSETAPELIEFLSGRGSALENATASFQSKYQIIKSNDSLLISSWKLSQTRFVYCYSAKSAEHRGQSEQLQMQILNKCLEGMLKWYNYSPAWLHLKQTRMEYSWIIQGNKKKNNSKTLPVSVHGSNIVIINQSREINITGSQSQSRLCFRPKAPSFLEIQFPLREICFP